MSDHPPSIKIKMLEDAGFRHPEIYLNYAFLVDFVKSLLKHSCCACAPECCVRCDAKTILERIGEYNEKP